MLSRRRFCKVCIATVGATMLGGWTLRGKNNPKAKENEPPATNREPYKPGYLTLESKGELEVRERALWEKMQRCDLCPRKCGVNRAAGQRAACSSDNTFKVASHAAHFGEERPLVGVSGSGTIFFSDCNLLCVFCQNWQINHRGDGRHTSHAQLADMMLSLQRRGCHNINLVTPTHIVPHIITALRIAIDRGLNIPLLYNSGGYESLEVLQLLDGVVDVYLPDFKYQDSEIAAGFSQGARNYVEHAAAAIKEMHRQVGVLKQNDGVAYQGLLIRHLVLPDNLAGTDKFVRWTVDELGADTHVNIMSQYSPQFRANDYPPLDRRLTQEEFAQAMRWAHAAGLKNFH